MATPNPHTLRTRRRAQLLSQRDLARLAKVSQRTISNIEAGHHRPHLTVRRKLLKALGLPFSQHIEVFGPAPTFGPPKGTAK